MSPTHFAERRHHLRVCLPFPAIVEGINAEGEPFRASTALDDLSAGGLYLRVVQRVKEYAELWITARLSAATDRGMVVKMRGKVLRVEPRPGGAFGLAVEIKDRVIL